MENGSKANDKAAYYINEKHYTRRWLGYEMRHHAHDKGAYDSTKGTTKD